MHYLKIVPMTAQDSGLTETAASYLVHKQPKLDWLIVEGATCSTQLSKLRDALPQTKGYIQRRHGFKLTLSSQSIVTRTLDNVMLRFRDEYGEPAVTR